MTECYQSLTSFTYFLRVVLRWARGADPTERTLLDADFFSFPALRNDFLHGNPK